VGDAGERWIAGQQWRHGVFCRGLQVCFIINCMIGTSDVPLDGRRRKFIRSYGLYMNMTYIRCT
jgi:hypothetical protein